MHPDAKMGWNLARGSERRNMKQSKRPTLAFAGVVVGGFVLYLILNALQGVLPGGALFDYNTWYANIEKSAFWRFLWMIGDATEPHFHKTLFGGIFVFIGSVIAYVLDKKRSKYRMTPISYGFGKIWPWIFCSAFLSVGIVTVLFAGLRFPEDAWSATFVPYVSVPSAVILMYGASIPVLLTGSILGAIFTTTTTIFIRLAITIPLGLPGVIGSVSGMWIGGIIVFEICHFLPWMKKNPLPASEMSPAKVDGETPISEIKKNNPNLFFLRRMVADYSEPMFVGNEIAGACLIIGSLLSFLLNPMHPAYNTGVFPALFLSQILTGAVAMYVYWDQWMEKDFFPTFVPVVSVAPAMVLMYGGGMGVVIISAILGGLTCPVIAVRINEGLPSHYHGMIGFTASMAINSALVAIFLRYLFMAFPGLAM